MEPSKEKRIADYVQFLQKGRTMTQLFRLPMDAEQAYEYLLAANMAEVQFRHRRFIHTDSVEDQLRQMADWLTADSPKFGIVLCGGYGNGKTTMLKAIQNLLNHLKIHNPNARSGFSDCYGLPVVDALHMFGDFYTLWTSGDTMVATDAVVGLAERWHGTVVAHQECTTSL